MTDGSPQNRDEQVNEIRRMLAEEDSGGGRPWSVVLGSAQTRQLLRLEGEAGPDTHPARRRGRSISPEEWRLAQLKYHPVVERWPRDRHVALEWVGREGRLQEIQQEMRERLTDVCGQLIEPACDICGGTREASP